MCWVGDRRREFGGGQPVRECIGVATVRRQVTAVGVPEAGSGVEDGEQIDRVEREVGDAVVLESDIDGGHFGTGRGWLAECCVEDRYGAEHRQPFEQPAVGSVGVADQDEVDVGLILRGQLAQQ